LYYKHVSSQFITIVEFNVIRNLENHECDMCSFDFNLTFKQHIGLRTVITKAQQRMGNFFSRVCFIKILNNFTLTCVLLEYNSNVWNPSHYGDWKLYCVQLWRQNYRTAFVLLCVNEDLITDVLDITNLMNAFFCTNDKRKFFFGRLAAADGLMQQTVIAKRPNCDHEIIVTIDKLNNLWHKYMW